jgi:hypothetical protein
MKRAFLGVLVLFFAKNSFSFTAGNCKYKDLVLGYLEEGYSYNCVSYTPWNCPCAPTMCDPITQGTLTSQRLWPASITYVWGESAYAPLDKIDYFAIRWRGVFYGSGEHTFYCTTDDGCRGTLFFPSYPGAGTSSSLTFSDGSSCWRGRGGSNPTLTECSVKVNLPSAGYHLLLLDYFEAATNARATFGWDPPDPPGKVSPIPYHRFMAQGVRMKVYSGTNFNSLACYRYVYSITFPSSEYPFWDTSTKGGCVGLVDNFSVRFTGFIIAPSDGTYRFCTVTDDGVRFYLDTNDDGELELLIDKWFPQAATEWSSNNVTLTRGPHAFLMEYYEEGGDAVARLGWGSNCDGNIGTFTPIPPNYLVMIDEECGGGERSTEGGGGGLFGCSYFRGKFLIYPILLIFITAIFIRIILKRGEA